MCTVVKEDPLFAAEDAPDMLLSNFCWLGLKKNNQTNKKLNMQTQHVPVEKKGEFESVVHAVSPHLILAPPPTNTTNLPWINLMFFCFFNLS